MGFQGPSRGAVPARAEIQWPRARHVLAVVVRPGEESQLLGGVLDGFRRRGAQISVLALTCGEASPYNSTTMRLSAVRPFEFEMAGFALRANHMTIAGFPDALLNGVPMERLADVVTGQARELGADLLITVQGAAEPACRAAKSLGISLFVWVPPEAAKPGDLEVEVDRTAQRRAMLAHRSQSQGTPAQLRRLAERGDRDWLRLLVPAGQ